MLFSCGHWAHNCTKWINVVCLFFPQWLAKILLEHIRTFNRKQANLSLKQLLWFSIEVRHFEKKDIHCWHKLLTCVTPNCSTFLLLNSFSWIERELKWQWRIGPRSNTTDGIENLSGLSETRLPDMWHFLWTRLHMALHFLFHVSFRRKIGKNVFVSEKS